MKHRWYSPKIAANLNRVYNRAHANDLAEGINWYARGNELCARLGTKYGVTTKQACGVMAALSPGAQWSRNIADCETFLDEWRHGARGKRLPLVGSYGWRNIVKASKIASGKEPLEVLGGPKVRAFYQCLVDPTDAFSVCIDRHAKSAAQGEKLKDSQSVVRAGGEYMRLSRHYIRGARHHNLVPHQFQAVIWVVWRRLNGVLEQQDLLEEVPF